MVVGQNLWCLFVDGYHSTAVFLEGFLGVNPGASMGFDPWPYGHGSKSRTPRNIPIPAKIGFKTGGAPAPKWDPLRFDNHGHMGGLASWTEKKPAPALARKARRTAAALCGGLAAHLLRPRLRGSRDPGGVSWGWVGWGGLVL